VAELRIREVLAGDAEQLLANLRQADADEADALLGPGQIHQALHHSIERSTMVWTGAVEDAVAFIFGVSPLSALSGQGQPWMVGTPLVDRHRCALGRLTPLYIARMLAAYPTLINVVDERNMKSKAWLRRAGFKLLPAIPMGTAGQPFHPFILEA
jgi:hypothetical protein